MRKSTFHTKLAAGLALVVVPIFASAQQPGAGSSMQMEPGPGSSMQSPPSGMGRPGAMARPVPINGHFSFPLASGCTYEADIRGNAQPARGASPAGEMQYTPNVRVVASVSCPNQTAMRVSETLSSSEPMPLAKIEQALELRASIITEATGVHCAYVPQFRLSQNRLEGVSAALLCPLPAQAAPARGGGR
jgi:hypothetical protein